jgi:hypothetical protein
MIIITNICGGGERRIRSVAALARIAGTRRPYGGWKVAEFTGVEDLTEDEARAILRWAGPSRRDGRQARTARDWREVAREAIAFDRRGNID